MASSAARSFPTIKAVRSYVIDGVGSGGDYHNVEGGHWYVTAQHSAIILGWGIGTPQLTQHYTMQAD